MNDMEKRMQVLCRHAIALIVPADKKGIKVKITIKADMFSVTLEENDKDFRYKLHAFCSTGEIYESDRIYELKDGTPIIADSFRSFENTKDILILLNEVLAETGDAY